ncbi:hypothetical protein [Actinomycetospora lemnae]|uniref:Uncharacterized protein n=1 Tax=Actinomycetospora lemnae TaxID=3019891 RepID=A0ABT5SUV1_9PSEU|nr:hypothetical protein [Actinomycetospora sp. DW7H6]MDD7966471.1 hypothetical protein [Actinomycetospora sp. DW7H6]
MRLPRSWRDLVDRDTWRSAAAREVAREAERVVARAAARDRLRAVEAEIAALLADEYVPARGRRLRALEHAREDLQAELVT